MTPSRRSTRPFVKSADTEASAANSRAEVDRLLARYGAVGFGFHVDREAATIVVHFVIPDRPGAANGNGSGAAPARVPVTLPVSVRAVYDALYGRPARSDDEATQHVHDPAGYDARRMEQAERVAWRNLVLWLDAALSAVSVGMQTVTETFLAHTLVDTGDGRPVRMIDYLHRTQGALAPGVRALLPSGGSGGTDG